MAATVMTQSNLGDSIATILTNEGILAARGATSWVKNCRFFTELGKEKGGTIQIPIFPTFTPETKSSETTDYTLQNGTDDKATITLTNEINIHLGYSVLAKMAIYPNYARQILENAYTAIYEKFATDVAAAVVDGSTGFSLATGTYGVAVSALEIQDACKQLFDQHYVISPDKVATILSSNDYYKGLLLDSDLSISQKESARDMGYIKNFAGSSIYPTQFVADDDSTGSKNFTAYMPEILIGNSVPMAGPKSSDWINIVDPESGLAIQMYEYGHGASGTDRTVVRTSYAITLARRTCGVIVKGAI